METFHPFLAAWAPVVRNMQANPFLAPLTIPLTFGVSLLSVSAAMVSNNRSGRGR